MMDYERSSDANSPDAGGRLARPKPPSHVVEGKKWEDHGFACHANADWDDAVAALETASMLIPLSPAGQVCLGQCYWHIGRTELSVELLTDLIESDRMTPPLLLQIATGLNNAGRPDLSMQACREAAASDSSFAQAYYDHGYYARRCGCRLSTIEALIRRAIAIAPDDVNYRIGLAGLYLENDERIAAYNVVKGLSNEQIDCVCCSTCLKRVAELYKEQQDYRRLVLCNERLVRLGTEALEH